jgi:tripartite-type tricarboxylate transporter receptor subunit TctC
MLAIAGAAFGAEYPTQSIKWVVMWRAGGGMDSYTRVFTKYMEKELGQNIIVQNITGGGGAIGYTAAKARKPDGYSLVSISSDMLRYKMMGTADIGLDDFDILLAFAYRSPIVVVRADSPFKTLADLVVAAKKKPGSLTVGVSDIGGYHHIPLMQFADSAGIKVRAVAHSGTTKITAGIMGGHLDFAVSSLKPTTPYLTTGKIRVLAHFGEGPIEALPGVPSMKKLGYNAKWGAYGGFGAPKGLTNKVKQTLMKAAKKVWSKPEFQSKLVKLGNSVIWQTDYREILLSLQSGQKKALATLGLLKK